MVGSVEGQAVRRRCEHQYLEPSICTPCIGLETRDRADSDVVLRGRNISSYSAIVGVWRWTGSDFSLDPSLKFDLYCSVNPVEVTIKSVTRPGPSDASAFSPGGHPRLGFRRSEPLPPTDNGADVPVQGTGPFDWSM